MAENPVPMEWLPLFFPGKKRGSSKWRRWSVSHMIREWFACVGPIFPDTRRVLVGSFHSGCILTETIMYFHW